jgi:hypothetical protein
MDAGKILVSGPSEQLIAQVPGCDNLGALFLHLTGKQLRD